MAKWGGKRRERRERASVGREGVEETLGGGGESSWLINRLWDSVCVVPSNYTDA